MIKSGLPPIMSLEKALGSSADVFVEYLGDYNHQQRTCSTKVALDASPKISRSIFMSTPASNAAHPLATVSRSASISTSAIRNRLDSLF
jgi:hypothetical protein